MLKILMIGMCCFFSLWSIAEECRLKPDEIVKHLKLEWDEFDQKVASGHRELATKGCFLEAAEIVDIFNLQHRETLDPSQLRILYFHAGQHYAYALLNEVAASRMLNAINPTETLNPELNWNYYVQASVAFLKKDRPSLIEFREKLKAAKATPGNLMNLNVVDNLLKCFSYPYSWAFEIPIRCK